MSTAAFRRAVVLLSVAAGLNALIFMHFNHDRIVPGTDSPEYDLMAKQLVADRGLTLDSKAPYLPTLYREPLYPLMVATIYKLAGPNVELVAMIQAILLGLSTSLAIYVAASVFGRAVGLLAGALFGLNSEVAHYAHWLLTEIPFTFLVLLTLALALKALERHRRLDLLLTGASLGLAILVRAIGGALLLPLVLVFTVARKRDRGQVLREVGLFLAGLAVVLAPWAIRNWQIVGHPAITSRLGVNLVRRAPRAAEPLADYPPQLVAAVWMMTNPLSQAVYPISRFQWGPNYEDNLIWDFHVNEMVRYLDRYQPVCEPMPDPDACYFDIGLAFVREYPVAYVVQTPFEVVKLLFAPLPGPQALIHNSLVWLSLATMVFLAYRRRLNRGGWLLLGVFVAYVALCVPVDTQQRYLVPMLPICAAFAAVPLWAVASRVIGSVRVAVQRRAHLEPLG
jgi:4-amino-4-deoxy-L-arabinose transferase-like glycosyltransferase